MNAIIQAQQGQLVIIDGPTPAWETPINLQHIWPTGIRASVYQHLIGQSCQYMGSGTYRTSDGLCIRLEHGGQTKPIGTIEAPIKKPRGMVAYYDGKWQKFPRL